MHTYDYFLQIFLCSREENSSWRIKINENWKIYKMQIAKLNFIVIQHAKIFWNLKSKFEILNWCLIVIRSNIPIYIDIYR